MSTICGRYLQFAVVSFVADARCWIPDDSHWLLVSGNWLPEMDLVPGVKQNLCLVL
jgi:hypothetical protein